MLGSSVIGLALSRCSPPRRWWASVAGVATALTHRHRRQPAARRARGADSIPCWRWRGNERADRWTSSASPCTRSTAHRLRTFLSASGIAVGIAAVILLTSIGDGIHRFVLAEFTQFGTNIINISPGKTSTHGASVGAIGSARLLTIEDALALKTSRYAQYTNPGRDGQCGNPRPRPQPARDGVRRRAGLFARLQHARGGRPVPARRRPAQSARLSRCWARKCAANCSAAPIRWAPILQVGGDRVFA